MDLGSTIAFNNYFHFLIKTMKIILRELVSKNFLKYENIPNKTQYIFNPCSNEGIDVSRRYKIKA